jgi:hypothetical protein
MLDVHPPPDWGTVVQRLAQQFTTVMSSVLTTINSTVVEMARIAYVSILLIGLLLYFTHAERRVGEDLIKGRIILGVLSEFVPPQISKI